MRLSRLSTYRIPPGNVQDGFFTPMKTALVLIIELVSNTGQLTPYRNFQHRGRIAPNSTIKSQYWLLPRAHKKDLPKSTEYFRTKTYCRKRPTATNFRPVHMCTRDRRICNSIQQGVGITGPSVSLDKNGLLVKHSCKDGFVQNVMLKPMPSSILQFAYHSTLASDPKTFPMLNILNREYCRPIMSRDVYERVQNCQNCP